MKSLKIAVVASVFASASTFAGYIFHPEVTVKKDNNYAYGSMIGARNSSDNKQYINCSFVGLNANSAYGICVARNAAGDTGVCTTKEQHNLEQIKGLSNESYLYIRWDDNGECNYIYSSIGSNYHQ